MVISAVDHIVCPPELYSLASSSFNELSASDRESLIQKRPVEPWQAGGILEARWGCQNFSFYEGNIIPILKRYQLECLHATRVLDPQRFRTEGLLTNRIDRYIAFLNEELKSAGFNSSDIAKMINLAKREYDRKYTEYNVTPKLCFFSGINQVQTNGTAGYDQFFETIGGELLRWPLQTEDPKLFSKLIGVGIPVIIRFEVPFTDIALGRQGPIAQQFFFHCLAKEIWNVDYSVEFDGYLNQDVSPEAIEDIISYA